VSFDAKPEFLALKELEGVLKLVTDEVASWRKRAQRAEASLGADYDAVASRERIIELEAENRVLHQRVVAARERVSELLKRLQFLEEQMAEEQAR
jgi:predicted  nucleic acid-binding Zn-ribbon protein